MKRPHLWGPLKDRYQARVPRKMLALDGGGIRGVLTLSILKSMEAQLGMRLCDYFDYIGGTSTGAIIAAGLSIGKSVDELIDFYLETGTDMFQRTRYLDRLYSLYRNGPLQQKLQEVFGQRDLRPEHLNTLLLAVTHNVTTDSPWPISSNPEARYNASRARRLQPLRPAVAVGPREHRGADLLSAGSHPRPSRPTTANRSCSSMAGMTPYNNPAFVLFRFATDPAYRLEWPTGERNLLLISVGTGAAATAGGVAQDPSSNMFSTGLGVPGMLMYGSLVDQDMNCRAIGRLTDGEMIDREVLDMVPRDGPDGRQSSAVFGATTCAARPGYEAGPS